MVAHSQSLWVRDVVVVAAAAVEHCPRMHKAVAAPKEQQLVLLAKHTQWAVHSPP